jgi:hypothetical protein
MLAGPRCSVPEEVRGIVISPAPAPTGESAGVGRSDPEVVESGL